MYAGQRCLTCIGGSVIDARGCLQCEKSPSPAGRSPQRGRVGEGVSDIIDEPKFQFFDCLLPSPPPLSQRERGLSAELQTVLNLLLNFLPLRELTHLAREWAMATG